jgi:hypothetical protein
MFMTPLTMSLYSIRLQAKIAGKVKAIESAAAGARLLDMFLSSASFFGLMRQGSGDSQHEQEPVVTKCTCGGCNNHFSSPSSLWSLDFYHQRAISREHSCTGKGRFICMRIVTAVESHL